MTDTDDTVGLTEDEHDGVVAALMHRWGCEDTDEDAYDAANADIDVVWPFVAARVAAERERADAAEAKIAAVEALAGEWEFDQGDLGNDTFAIRDAAACIRAALAPREDTQL